MEFRNSKNRFRELKNGNPESKNGIPELKNRNSGTDYFGKCKFLLSKKSYRIRALAVPQAAQGQVSYKGFLAGENHRNS